MDSPQPQAPPASPSAPAKRRYLISGGAAGAILGAVAAFIPTYFLIATPERHSKEHLEQVEGARRSAESARANAKTDLHILAHLQHTTPHQKKIFIQADRLYLAGNIAYENGDYPAAFHDYQTTLSKLRSNMATAPQQASQRPPYVLEAAPP